MSQSPQAAPPPELNIALRVVDETTVVDVTGDIDMDSAPKLRDALTSAIDDATDEPCILNLTEVGFLDSAGLTTLVDAAQHADVLRKPLRIVVGANSPVIRPIEITGLDKVLRLYHTVDEALAADNSEIQHDTGG